MVVEHKEVLSSTKAIIFGGLEERAKAKKARKERKEMLEKEAAERSGQQRNFIQNALDNVYDIGRAGYHSIQDEMSAETEEYGRFIEMVGGST